MQGICNDAALDHFLLRSLETPSKSRAGLIPCSLIHQIQQQTLFSDFPSASHFSIDKEKWIEIYVLAPWEGPVP
jgi:hypothetical protein